MLVAAVVANAVGYAAPAGATAYRIRLNIEPFDPRPRLPLGKPRWSVIDASTVIDAADVQDASLIINTKDNAVVAAPSNPPPMEFVTQGLAESVGIRREDPCDELKDRRGQFLGQPAQ